ncbi:hypothetical protein [Rhodococcus tibetensis]|uniref:Uncharacterized protein n=1 Tax=Rhodococcus tibetensis TaxID=2965064 RepID=A0ABT1QC94_9NOCA|nr:hypothetical protein [Rhodococcus sp. FXJ9.536]MCQ4119904.1 hypothetical protein [Rhodococcus sp. FXJ9.536]
MNQSQGIRVAMHVALPFIALLLGVSAYAGFRTQEIPERPLPGTTQPHVVTCGSYLTGGTVSEAQETATVAACATISATSGLLVWTAWGLLIAIAAPLLLWITFGRHDAEPETPALPVPPQPHLLGYDHPQPGDLGWYERPGGP